MEVGYAGAGATAAGCFSQRETKNACQQQHTASDQADDRCGPQGGRDTTEISKARHVDDENLARVAGAVVGRHGVADLWRRGRRMTAPWPVCVLPCLSV